MLLDNNGVYIHEVDGSGITTIGTDGSVRFHDDDVTPTYLVRDRFEGDRDGGWTSTENETDLDFLNGQRLSTLGSTEDGHRHIHGISDLTKMVQLNDVYRQLPLFFEFTFHDGSQNENIQIYLGDMTNQWGEPQPEEHRLKFDIGALSVRTFDPYAGDSDREGKVEIDIVDLGNDAWDVKIRFDGGGAPILPVTGVEGVKLNGIDVAIPKFLKVHVDMGSNGSSDRAKLGDFRVLQYHPNKEPLDTASALVDYYALFDHFTLTHLGAADSQSLENSIGTNITALGGFVKNVDDKLNAHNIADFDFQEYSGYETTPGKNQVDTYFDKLDTALVNLSALTSGENTSSASLADYNALMWGEYVIEDPSITDKALAALAIAGFAIGLASGLGSIALATSALYVAEEVGELELTALGTAEANGTLGGGEIIDGDLFADSFQDPDLYKETAGTAAYWDTGNVKKMGDLATSAGSFGGYAFLSSETFHAGMPDSATAKGLFGSINQPSISDTMTRAVIAFVTSTEAYENSSNPDQTKVNTYNGYAETLEEKLVDFQITAAESVANFTALSFVREYILGPDTKYSVPIVTDAQNKTLDQEEAMWIALGFDVVVSASVARSGVVDLGYGSIHTNYYETTFEIRDGTGDGGTDLEGIDGFHYKVAHEDLYSHKDYYTDFGVWT
jgi:hypothetical protein